MDWQEERRRKRAKLREVLERMPAHERELRAVLAGGDLTLGDVQREIYVTPYAGAYGPAGVVIAVNGSPPQGLALVTTDTGRAGASVVLFRDPGWPARPMICDQHTKLKYSSGKRLRVYTAVLAYLDAIGVFDDRGGRVLDFAPYVGQGWPLEPGG